jgi:serine/threonine protein kinase
VPLPLPTRHPPAGEDAPTDITADATLDQGSRPYTAQAATTTKPIGKPGHPFLPPPGAAGPSYLPPHLKPLQDKFEFLEKLGDGGFGEVWRVRVRNSVLDIERAVKVIKAQVADDRQFVERMVREAQAMARLNHPHAVAVHFASRDPAYIEMDYIRGKTLEQVLAEQGPCHRMSLEWTARFLDQLCSVLQLAHKNQIIHRDLKPSNLMLADAGADGPGEELDLKVLDFGIAKFLNPAPDAFKTFGGAPLTPLYTSPEQGRGETDLDARSDIFAVGLILYRLLTGHHPFWSPSDSIYSAMVAIFNDVTPRFRERNPEVCVPESIEALVLRCLDKDPARRPASAATLAEEFRRLVSVATTQKGLVASEPAGEGTRWSGRFRLLGPLVMVVGFLGAFLGIGVANWLRPVPPALSAIKAVPPQLKIRAGTSEPIDIFAPDDPARPLRVRVIPGYPEGIRIQPSELTDSVAPRFRVEISPEFVGGEKPVMQRLAFAATVGGVEHKVTVDLAIAPPDVVRLPGQWVRSPASKLIKIGETYYPKEIERDVGGVRIEALLIERRVAKPGPVQPDPFYMMKNKVWVGLFEVFAREHPGAVTDSAWRQGGDPLLPVRNVNGPQAQAFADWLGGAGHGYLPTQEQWDQAAGKNLQNAPSGPFQEPWDAKAPDQVAVGLDRRAPLAVGLATHDISPYGCRDMAGNGWEWTRPGPDDKPDELVALRAQSFKGARPFAFEDIKRDDPAAKPFNQSDDQTGFRVVIELDPSG